MCNNQLGGALITQNLLGEWLISNKNRHIAVGVLVLVLIVAFANISGCKNEVETPTFEGSLIGPTFRVKPGDTI